MIQQLDPEIWHPRHPTQEEQARCRSGRDMWSTTTVSLALILPQPATWSPYDDVVAVTSIGRGVRSLFSGDCPVNSFCCQHCDIQEDIQDYSGDGSGRKQGGERG